MIEKRANAKIEQHVAERCLARISFKLVEEVLSEYVEVLAFIGVISRGDKLQLYFLTWMICSRYGTGLRFITVGFLPFEVNGETLGIIQRSEICFAVLRNEL